ncbi:polymeric immunoglobulin receptor-like [Danio aesculapii]|uniref:polymeric immunoglobulin receptor-like n=1 Tax=Danio aesculapii TaxID=1142201 RepID=UPI0024C04FCD|nr:polymeric immunoglobulin receptor-like [Danio aesculapii]
MIHISDNKLLIFTLLILMAVVDSEMKTIFTGHEGGRVKIQCPYSESEYEGNQKYLCRGECSINPIYINRDIPVESGSAPKDERFSLTENRTAHNFTITITDLRTADQGKYWCAVKTALLKPDDYKEIYLEIKQVSRVSGEPGKHLSITCSYTGDLKDHLRFLCKGSDPSDCKNIIKVSSEINTNGRFSLTDDSERVFTVNISNLTEEDSGIYWCGAVKNQTQEYTWISAVNLEITKATSERRLPKNTTTVSFHTSKPAETASSRPVTPSSSSSSSISMFSSWKSPLVFAVSITLITSVMLIVLGLSVFVFLRWRPQKKGTDHRNAVHEMTEKLLNTEEAPGDIYTICHYEELI